MLKMRGLKLSEFVEEKEMKIFLLKTQNMARYLY